MGVIPGHIKNEVVVLGAHRDGEGFCSFGIPSTNISVSLGDGSERSNLRYSVCIRGNPWLWGPDEEWMEALEDNPHCKLGR